METLLFKIAGYIIAPFVFLGSLFSPFHDIPVAPISAPSNLGSSNAIESPVALFSTTLANSITSTASTMTLTSATTKDGTSLASSTYSFIIDEGTASEEFVKADCTGTSCTAMDRGLSVLSGTTTVASLQKAHRRGASVKITDAPILLNLRNIINGNSTFPNIISYTSHPTFNASTQIVDKSYVDSVAFGSSTVAVTAGGTGATSFLAGTLLVGNGTSALSSTSSPSVGFINATTTTATSTFSGNVAVTGNLTVSGSSALATTSVTSLTVNGASLTASKFGGTGTDGAFVATSTTVIDLGSAKFVEKNYTSISITGTTSVSFINPNNAGTIVSFLSQGDCSITSSTSTAIDLRNLGGIAGVAGGAGGTGNGNGGGGGAGSTVGGNASQWGTTGGSSGTTGTGYGSGVVGGYLQTGGVGGTATVSGTGGIAPNYDSTFAKYTRLFVMPGSGGGG
ncbi:MAG: collagen triple helix repeat protein, partial [Promethearchaeota archaeon CR_4]